MELVEFARNILMSGSLSEKLADGGVFTDHFPRHGQNLPSLPARSEALSLERWKASAKVGFPSRSDLLNPTQVGVLLHFFANHELLALELMALALLKFPDAPPAFRMGIAHTMNDEQRHLSAYIERMGELGLSFGDIPLNDFFWAQCSSMQTPMDYVCRMSMTFEQANLDFAAYFRDVLKEMGDEKTAQMLEEVLQDEMNHVRHGLNWFKRWKPGNESDWQSFCKALGGDINPSRAKGNVFREDYRTQVGFSEDYIKSLLIFSQSKGRPPRVAFFNPEAEEEIRLAAQRGPVLSQNLMLARDDLAPVMIYVATQTDVVLLGRALPKEFLVGLRSVGMSLPELQQVDLTEKNIFNFIKTRKVSGLLPWSASPTSMRLEARSKLDPLVLKGNDTNVLRRLHSKATAVELLKEFLSESRHDDRLIEPEFLGMSIFCPEDFNRFIQACSRSFEKGQFIAKRPWSASGRHRVFGEFSQGYWESQPVVIRNWFEKSWRMGEIPIAQPYFDRLVDISIQAKIDNEGGERKVHILGLTRVLNSERGQYMGSCVGRFLDDADPQVVRFFHQRTLVAEGISEGLEEVLHRLAKWTGAKLADMGLSGAFGIDAFIFRHPNGSLRLHPMIEVNPRHTMGRVSVALGRRMVPGRVGVWLHVSKPLLGRLKASSFVELRERWKALFPMETFERSGGVVIANGMLETTPAEQCEQVWTCFLVLQNLKRDLKQLGLDELLEINAVDPKVDKPAMQL